jgi:hypothetical protein
MLRNVVAVLLTATFVFLAGAHVYWAFGGRLAVGTTIPTAHGTRLFEPSPTATLMVAAALLIFACAIAAARGWLGDRIPMSIIRLLIFGISLVFLLRAIGDFRYVGFFREVSDTPFAYWDLRLYSPLCVAIALATLVVPRNRYREP